MKYLLLQVLLVWRLVPNHCNHHLLEWKLNLSGNLLYQLTEELSVFLPTFYVLLSGIEVVIFYPDCMRIDPFHFDSLMQFGKLFHCFADVLEEAHLQQLCHEAS